MRQRMNVFRRALIAAGLVAVATTTASAQSGVRVDTDWAFESDAAQAGGTVYAALHVVIEDRFHVHSNKPLDPFLIPTVLKITAPEGISVRQIVYPEPILLNVEFSEQPLAVLTNDFVIGVALEIAGDLAPGSYAISSELQYQACDDKVCLAPATLGLDHSLKVVSSSESVSGTGSPLFERVTFSQKIDEIDEVIAASPDQPTAAVTDEGCDVVAELDGFDVLGTAGGFLKTDDFVQFIDDAETGVTQTSLFEGRGIVTIVALIILGGIALNLTPCVLPLIPINLAIIGAGAQAGSRVRGFALGGTYGLAMAAVYGVLGLVVILTASTFGAINSTIWFNLGIAILFVVLALAMFDVIAIDFTKFQGKINMTDKAKRGTFALAFGMGAVAALLAGACVAPVVIQVIVYSGDQFARGTSFALALPFFLGLGMALPWPFAGAGLSCLPKPGMWMVRVKQAMGVFILAFAAYYGYLAWEINSNRRAAESGVLSATHVELEEGWTASLCEGLATARDENKLVLVDMWATWCKNCFAMDKTTFKDEQVIERLDDYVKVKFQAEDLDAMPARQVLERFEGIGLPAYAILRPGDVAGESGP